MSSVSKLCKLLKEIGERPDTKVVYVFIGNKPPMVTYIKNIDNYAATGFTKDVVEAGNLAGMSDSLAYEKCTDRARTSGVQGTRVGPGSPHNGNVFTMTVVKITDSRWSGSIHLSEFPNCCGSINAYGLSVNVAAPMDKEILKDYILFILAISACMGYSNLNLVVSREDNAKFYTQIDVITSQLPNVVKKDFTNRRNYHTCSVLSADVPKD